MERAPAVVSRIELERTLWGEDPPEGDVLRSHVHGLRKAVDRDEITKLLRTVHGVGYRITE